MENGPQAKTDKSPLRKLVRFFEQSRDPWKAKSRAAKVNVQRWQNRVRFLEASQADLKQPVKTLEAEGACLKANERPRAQDLAVLQKRGPGS